MTTGFKSVRNFSRHHRLSIAASLVIALLGTYLFITGRSTTACNAACRTTVAYSSRSRVITALSSLSSPSSLRRYRLLPDSDDFFTLIVPQCFRQFTRQILVLVKLVFGKYCGFGVHDTTLYFLFCRLLAVVITIALPEALSFLAAHFPSSWTGRKQIYIASALQTLVLISFTDQGFSAVELLAAALVMVSYDMFQRALDRDTNNARESEQQPHEPSVAETVLMRTRSVHSLLAKSDLPNPPNTASDDRNISNTESGVSKPKPNAADSKDKETVRLQRALTELKTANKAQEVVLRSTREELKNARETLNETFTEYCSLRDEMKTFKQNMARKHQAVVYRKDIELFALRKGNEQKEKYIKEHDAQLDAVYRQQKAKIELKDTQMKMLKDRLSFLDRQASPKMSLENDASEEGDHALEIRLLRVRKGRTAKDTESLRATQPESPRIDEEKDAIIASLREQIAVAKKASDEIVNQQAELQRAWDVAKKMQAALKEERQLHCQTQEQLQEMTVKLEEGQQRSRANSTGRLPTISEDKDELEAMFDTAQEDNLRLYAEMDALERRLRDANARMFTAEQEAAALRAQMQLDNTISDDLENAHPSVVHHVHFQRLEGQLKESRDILAAKVEEIALLKKSIAGKDNYIKDLKSEVDAAVSFHTQDQDEIERLQQLVTELQATKEQLMRDHERLALQRSRLGISLAEAERISVRSSGATLIQELSPQLTRPSDEIARVEALSPMLEPVEQTRGSSIQEMPKRHVRSGSTPNRWSLISSDAPPPGSRASKRRGLGLNDIFKKLVKRDAKPDKVSPETPPVGQLSTPEPVKGRIALIAKDKNALLRPKTTALTVKLGSQAPVSRATSDPMSQIVRPPNRHTHTQRYYAMAEGKDDQRPKTATTETKKSEEDAARPTSRRSWAAT